MENFSELYYIGLLFQNDLKHIRTHAAGAQYDIIRNICDEMISKLDTELRDFSDFACEEGNPIDNPANIKSHIEVEPLTQEVFTWSDFVEYLNGSLVDFIEAIESFDLSFLNDDIMYWKLQLKHNSMRRWVPTETGENDPDAEKETTEENETLEFNGVPDDVEEDKTGALPEVQWPDIMSGAGITQDKAALDKPDEESDSAEDDSDEDEEEAEDESEDEEEKDEEDDN